MKFQASAAATTTDTTNWPSLNEKTSSSTSITASTTTTTSSSAAGVVASSASGAGGKSKILKSDSVTSSDVNGSNKSDNSGAEGPDGSKENVKKEANSTGEKKKKKGKLQLADGVKLECHSDHYFGKGSGEAFYELPFL